MWCCDASTFTGHENHRTSNLNMKYSGERNKRAVLLLLLLFKEKSAVLLLLLLLLFLTFSVLVANPKKLLYTVANPARGLLNREKRTKEKVWQHTPPTPHTARSEKINKITRRIYRRYAGLGRSRVRTWIPSPRRLGLWVWLRKILHSSLR